ncbi:MAG: histidinol dehydrogenase [Pirellulales bacterium]
MSTPLTIQRIDTRQSGATEEIAQLQARLAPDGNVVSEASRNKTIEVFGEPLTPVQVVDRICEDVRQQGVEAILKYTTLLDGATLSADQLRVPTHVLKAAHQAAEPEFLETIRRIRARLLRFQQAILHTDVTVPTPHEGYLRQRYLPLERVGICVPGGAAAYPSTVLMTAVPAQAAGVPQLAVIAPPTPFGSYNQDLLATCHELGIDEVYRIGGAQGVAALAHGIASNALGDHGLPPVDKIVGPGNLFVALAKKHVFGTVDIDSIAGPSEVIVLADHTTRADFAAADMIAQAEHAPGSSIVITWHAPLLDQIAAALENQLATLERGDLARVSLESFGAMITVRDRNEAADLANQLATEHLHIACDDAESMLQHIRHAGAIFIGPYSPVPLGDYVAGPSHVLPTGATARFASGLSSNDFLRAGSVIHFSQEGLEAVAPDAMKMSAKEGLTAHGTCVAMRRKEPNAEWPC